MVLLPYGMMPKKKQGAQMQPKALASYLTNCNNNSTPKINREEFVRDNF